ncbi:MAG: DEAD/DEAH box helicase [Actinobacteria bacterium]|nr:DEAD/DEAH box helicase [Actinomycetota bacterium]
MTEFAGSGLPDRLVQALARSGVRTPFPIQAAALPDALAGNDLLGKAATGSGKTLAFGLPLLARLAAGSADPRGARAAGPRGLVLLPTRELAQQVTDVLTALGQSLRLRVVPVYGGASIAKQIGALRHGADIVVATPGRLEDLLERGAVRLDHIDITVLDEADHLCDLGFLPPIRRLLNLTPAGGQRLLFSATLDGDVDSLVREYLNEPVLVDVAPHEESSGEITYHLTSIEDRAHRLRAVVDLAQQPGRCLLFVRTKHGADRLARQMTAAGVVSALPLHGGMHQGARTRALKQFATERDAVLVATDVAARGLHVDGIDTVVHVDLPADQKTFLHRCGRTGRAGADGTVVVLAATDEAAAARKLLRAVSTDAH